MRYVIAIAALLTLAAGCARRTPSMSAIYDEAALAHDERRNPVIVIPGILGSRLVDDDSGRVVWGAFSGDYANPERPDGARLLALPMATGAELADLKDDVREDALDRLRVDLFGVPVQLDAYVNILGTLGVGGYRDEGLGLAGAVDYGDEHFTCFQFAYDWRRDNVENARRLHEFIEAKRAYVEAENARVYGATGAPVKFDIVAHSMGGLITRYYLRYGGAEPPAIGETPVVTWAGARHVDRVILVGTPSAGSAEAVQQLVAGAKFAPFLPEYAPAVLGTMPSIYQLLPRPRHGAVVDATTGDAIDVLDPAVWECRQWGLADPGQARVLEILLPDLPPDERAVVARDRLRKCLERADRFFAALDVPAVPPPHLRLSLIVGDSEPTVARLGAGDDARLRVLDRQPGDGTVLRSSAVMDERVGGVWRRGVVTPIEWDSVMFLFENHLNLTKSPEFVDNVLYELLESPR